MIQLLLTVAASITLVQGQCKYYSIIKNNTCDTIDFYKNSKC